jgi:hypothetical protein
MAHINSPPSWHHRQHKHERQHAVQDPPSLQMRVGGNIHNGMGRDGKEMGPNDATRCLGLVCFISIFLFFLLTFIYKLLVDLLVHAGQRGPTKAIEGHRRPSKSPTKANEDPRRPTKANEDPRRPTRTHEGQRRPTRTHEDQREPTKANDDPRRPTKAHASQRGPTQANEGQRGPTKANEGLRKPTRTHASQRRPTRAHASQRRPKRRDTSFGPWYVLFLYFFFLLTCIYVL